MFIHNVYFYLKNKESKEDAAALVKGIKSLFDIEVIETSYVGECMPSHRAVVDSTYSYHLSLAFKGQEAHDAYQVHPVHQKFIDDCAHLWEKVKIYDSATV